MVVNRKFLFKKIFIFLILILLFGCNKPKEQKLYIATAANMQFAMKELITVFTNETGIKCESIISSSGKLTAQIKEGAPYDIFVSANMKYPNELNISGFSSKKPKVYALGKLVLWTMIDSLKPSINLLLNKNVKHIASANPKIAPYGIPTEQVLKYYKLFNKIEHKLVYGESIAQTNQFITTMAAEIGFTAKSVVLSPNMKGKGNWIDINENAYTPIEQGVLILKKGPSSNKKKELFYKFLFSNKGKAILNNFGYSTDF